MDRSANREETARRVAERDRKLNQYRAALDAAASPTAVAGWIAETEAEKARLQASQSRTARQYSQQDAPADDRGRDHGRR